MRATVAKKLRKVARQNAEQVFRENVVVEPKWYARKWIFKLWAWPVTQFVVAANKQDLPDAWSPEDLRIALNIDNGIKVLPCVALDKECVKTVLLELLYTILERVEEG